MINFSVILPTRERPKQLERMLTSLFSTASKPDSLEVILYQDEDDIETNKIDAKLEAWGVERIIGPKLSMGKRLSTCIAASSGDVLFFLNDDVVVRTQDWDRLINEEVSKFSDQIYLLYPNDLFKGKSYATFPIISRKLCEIIVDPFPAAYEGSFLDIHIMDIFKRLQGEGGTKIKYLEDIVFEHLHFRAGKSEYDNTYENRIRFGDDRTFLTHAPVRQWCSSRLRAVILGVPVESVGKLTPPRKNEGWMVLGIWRLLADEGSTLTWRGRLFVWMMARYIYNLAFNRKPT